MEVPHQQTTVQLQECIELFTTVETLEEENPWYYCPTLVISIYPTLSVLLCHWKLFRPLDIFHILLRYSLIVTLIKYKIKSSAIYTQYLIMTKQKLLKHYFF